MTRIPVELPAEAAAPLVAAVVEAMKEEGLVIPGPDRTAPYSVAEMVEETGLSASQVRKMVEAGIFERVRHVGRVLVTVGSVRRWQEGQA